MCKEALFLFFSFEIWTKIVIGLLTTSWRCSYPSIVDISSNKNEVQKTETSDSAGTLKVVKQIIPSGHITDCRILILISQKAVRKKSFHRCMNMRTK